MISLIEYVWTDIHFKYMRANYSVQMSDKWSPDCKKNVNPCWHPICILLAKQTPPHPQEPNETHYVVLG